LPGRFKLTKDADIYGEKEALAANNTIVDVNENIVANFLKLTSDSDIESEWLKMAKEIDVDIKAALKELREIAQSY